MIRTCIFHKIATTATHLSSETVASRLGEGARESLQASKLSGDKRHTAPINLTGGRPQSQRATLVVQRQGH